ncbi:MAG: NADH-quinone oxidoreductase subunit C [Coriobacteriales bacterium]|nr:NADH-quinone oxidoreductase subunit C [Coriobacteriales bacterium]
MSDHLEELRERISELDPTIYPLFSIEFGDAVIAVPLDDLLVTMHRLRELGFDRLGMVTAVDRPEFFVLVYRLHSRALSAGLFVKAKVHKEDPVAPSMFEVWPAADWQEREVFDLFGIDFEGHPDLKRIFLPDEFEGHPLRKDYDHPRVIRRPDYI